MKFIAATDARRRFGVILNEAQQEPVVVQRQNRDVAVILSMAEFARLKASDTREFLKASRNLAFEARRNKLTPKRLAQLLALKE